MEIELPREKLLRLGPKYLEMRELLSIILNNGSKTESVFEISDRIIKDYGLDLSIFKSVEQIVEQLKIPLVKASQICSCMEIGRRIFDKNEDIFINSSKKIYENFKYLSNLKQIEFYLVILNNKNKIISKNLIYIGENISNYNIKEIFKILFEVDFNKFFIVCGLRDMDINKEYISFAIELKEKSIFLNISFIDFVIIKDNSFISFKDKGII